MAREIRETNPEEQRLEQTVLTYEMNELPDPFYSQYQAEAGGDVRSAIWRGSEHLLHVLGNMAPGSAAVSLRMVYHPCSKTQDMQSRLRVFLIARSDDEEIARNLRLLIEYGPLSRFYNPKKAEVPQIPWEVMKAACDVVRREDLVEPLYTPEFNSNIPSRYCRILSFEANEKNDFLALDNVLGNLKENVTVDICVEPTDISGELSEHTRYLARLQAINRGGDRDDYEESTDLDFIGEGLGSRPNRRSRLKLPRYRDPLADNILHGQRQFHETLFLPHLLFRIRVMAETTATANLIGSIVAESSFKEGYYRLLVCTHKDQAFSRMFPDGQVIRAADVGTHDATFDEMNGGFYPEFRRLSHVASVKELVGAFRLPVASSRSPTCIRKNTDPVHEDEDQLIVLGYDQDPPTSGFEGPSHGLRRGILVDGLQKHCFVSGMSGYGKSTAILNMLIQL